MASTFIDSICNTTLLDLNETWYTSRPFLTPCMQQTLLSWIPAVAAIVCTPAFFYTNSLQRVKQRLQLTVWLTIKWVLTGAMIVNLLVTLLYIIIKHNKRDVPIDDKHSTRLTCQIQGVSVRLITVTYIGVITGVCFTEGVLSSGTVFLACLSLTLCAVPQLHYSIVMLNDYSSTEFVLCAVFISTGLVLTVMHCFVDTTVQRGKPQLLVVDGEEEVEFKLLPSTSDTSKRSSVEKSPSPELYSSFLNRALFWYFNEFSLKGFKKPLDTDDLYLLNEEDKLGTLIRIWKEKYLRGRQKIESEESFTIPHTISGSISVNGGTETTLQESRLVRSLSRRKSMIAKEKKRNSTAVIWTILRIHGLTLLGGCALQLTNIILIFSGPRILNWLIILVGTPSAQQWHGFLLAAMLFLVNLGSSFVSNSQTFILSKLGLRASAVLTGAVFEKALRLNAESRQAKSIGQVVNLMSVDVANFQPISWFVMLIWASPLKLFIGFYMLWQLLHEAMLAGFVVVPMVMIPAYFLLRKLQQWQKEQMALKDERLKLMSEILNGIKVFKLYAWELSLQQMVMNIRERELAVIRKVQYVVVFGTAVIFSLPFFIAASSFFAYVFILEQPLTPQIAFVSLSLFNILRFPMLEMPMMLAFAIQVFVSNRRISEFLNADELSAEAVERLPNSSSVSTAVSLSAIFAHWGAPPPEEENTKDKSGSKSSKTETKTEKSSKENTKKDSKSKEEKKPLLPISPILKDLELHVKKGECVAVVGRVGMGKTTLLNTILGETVITGGRVRTYGSLAYVAQIPWIQNATVRDNVLFGCEYDEERYNNVIEVCALNDDLEILAAGDRTEIGEKGINLSGGQKQRVAIARAVYHDADVYLLDDPLSAVDPHVGQHIFEKVIGARGILANKTVILVTHQLLCLPNVDLIHVVKDGRIAESGTYGELLQSGSEFTKVLEEMKRLNEKEVVEETEVVEDVVDVPGSPISANGIRIRKRLSTSHSQGSTGHQKAPVAPTIVKSDDQGKLIEEEEAETGRVHWRVYFLYFKSLGVAISVMWMLFFGVAALCEGAQNGFLSYWSSQNNNITANNTRMDTLIPISIYTAIGLGQTFWVLIATGTQVIGSLRASKELHHNLVKAVFRAPLQFFDVTPVGRILNRTGRDLNSIDFQIPNIIRTWWSMIIAVLLVLSIILISTPTFAVVILPLTVAYVALTMFYIRTSRQLVRLQAITKSPVYQHFQEALQGVSTIRAFNSSTRFIGESQRRVDLNNSCFYPNLIASAWLWIRLEFIGNFITVSAAVFSLLYSQTGEISAGMLGLSITYAMGVTGALGGAVQMSSALEQQVVSVERVKDYTNTEAEASWTSDSPPPAEWPSAGQIRFQNVSLRYRAGLDKVLNGITFEIKPRQRVGIVGRTGAGKSSLTLALFRMIEVCDGQIIIDGINVATIGLHELRSRLTIIPQDPVLFCASVRDNLDPLHEYSDDRIWQALEHAHLKEVVHNLPTGLDHKIVEGGDNLSVGQRQLMCLARALLRRSRILVMDEATAACDLETDQLIQHTIKTEFSDCTVLTIAHRLNTIMDSHKVLVLDMGRVVEFDSPSRLLANPDSLFYSMTNAQSF